MSDCLFCKIVAGQIPATKVREDEHTVAFRDINAQAPTHVLVIPKRHVPAFGALTAEDGPLLAHMANAVNAVAEAEGVAGTGFRVVCNNGAHAGQTVDHMHWHVLGGRNLGWPPG
ncbi:MAG: histidine triad nucleotide-binding protein [Cyanobacteria bacterium RYN_339]|nr:histidine triad nucleotide-binding protein [Cyanobacteria bacterium RYN_339]